MATSVIVPLEEAGGKALKEWAKGVLSHSGEAQLRSLGDEGEFTANLLKKYEQFSSANMSFSRESIKQVFDSVPEQYHQELENRVLGKPHTLPQQYVQNQAQTLNKLKNVIEQKAQQSGQHVSVNGRRIPFTLHPDGPYVHHPNILKSNDPLRRLALQELEQVHGIAKRDTGKVLDNIVNSQNGRNGVAHVAFPSLRLNTGRLPVAQRWMSYGEKAAERISQNVMFGPQDQQLQGITEAIRQSKGTVSANTLADFLDIYFKENGTAVWRRDTGVLKRSAYTPTQDVERILHKVSGYIMTSRIALPHSMQLINTVLNEGLRNTLVGVYERLFYWNQLRDFVINSGALEEELSRNMRQVVEGKQGWFEKFFHQPGFNWIRSRQVEISALAGKHEAIEASYRFLQGDTRAELTLKRLGIDTQELQRTGVITDTMKQQAAYNSAKQAIFFRTPLNTPFKRESGPLSRLVFTYSHYHFNMFRTIKNSLKNVYAEQGLPGVAKWALKLGIIFPVAGELVQLAENGLYRRKDLTQTDITTKDIPIIGNILPQDNKELDMYFNALAHASAFGIIYSINRANKQTMITNFFTGPIVGTGINVTTDITKAILGTKTRSGGTRYDFRPVERDVLRHVPVIGPALSETLVPYEDKPITKPRHLTRLKKYEEEGFVF